MQVIQVGAGLVPAPLGRTLVHPTADIAHTGAVCLGRPTGLLHDAAAAAAHHLSCQGMDHTPGIAAGTTLHHLLHRIVGFLVDDGFVGILHHDPLGLGEPDRPLGLVTHLFVSSLHQIPGIGLVVKHLVDRPAAPQRLTGRFPGKLVVLPVLLLVRCRAWHPLLV